MHKNFVQKHMVLTSLILFCFILLPLCVDSYGEAKSKDIVVAEEVAKVVVPEPEVTVRKRVVLDAGHGGYDVGSESVLADVVEKDIALEITLLVGQYLQMHEVDVIYTRESDAVPWPASNVEDLLKRSEIANTAGADCFVSIHMNYSEVEQESVRGNEIWVRYSNDANVQLATNVNEQLKQLNYTDNRGLKDEATSPLSLLEFNTIPSILVETGFLSNLQDSKALTSKVVQKQVAEAIAKGILQTVGVA